MFAGTGAMDTADGAIRWKQEPANAFPIGDGLATKQLEPGLRNSPGEFLSALDQKSAIADRLEQTASERDLLAEVLNGLAVAVILVDPKHRIVHTNAAAEELLAEGRTLSSI